MRLPSARAANAGRASVLKKGDGDRDDGEKCEACPSSKTNALVVVPTSVYTLRIITAYNREYFFVSPYGACHLFCSTFPFRFVWKWGHFSKKKCRISRKERLLPYSSRLAYSSSSPFNTTLSIINSIDLIRAYSSSLMINYSWHTIMCFKILYEIFYCSADIYVIKTH